eukprot:TRINITY_DN54507_c0_g1_i1.p1 TRINITY_DN54507_c0_g1~~TRINITY_DN54507_c0_g1_i1.p1  ORF type:complete len:432 (-),score=114.41 TRINITY_DN54507_c0_g1_i1:38-1333(-)
MAELPPQRVTVYDRGTAQAGYRDRASILAGAQDALFSAPTEVQRQSRAFAAAGIGPDESASEDVDEEEGEEGREFPDNEEELPEEDPLDDDHVYLTEGFREWEKHYMRRLAMRIHRMVACELDRSEEAILTVFIHHDTNLDGRIRGEEVTNLLQVIEDYAPGSTTKSSPRHKDGSVSFVSLLRWFSGSKGGEHKETSFTFNATALMTAILGSGAISCDSRLQALDWTQLRRNVMGYRRLYQQLRDFKEQRLLAPALEHESHHGIFETMPEYYKVLAAEFEGDMELLFELFCEVDESNNLLLEENEVIAMLRHMDSGATPDEVKRYIAEINLDSGPLSFASLIDWWDQAQSVANSLVAEKGALLIAGIKGRSYTAKVAGMLGESAVMKRWEQANNAGTLQELRAAYLRTFHEVREYKVERDLQRVEAECAQL